MVLLVVVAAVEDCFTMRLMLSKVERITSLK